MSRRSSHKGRRSRQTEVSVGVIHIARKGYGFVDTPEGEYFVLRGSVHGAMDGDLVEVVRLRKLEQHRRAQMRHPSAQQKRQVGEGGREQLGGVRRVLERAHTTIIGTLHYTNGLGVVIPDDEHIPYDIFLDLRAISKPAKSGDVVVVRMTTYPSKLEAAQGYIEEVLGQADDEGMGIEVIIRRHGLETTFSATALEEAEGLLRDVRGQGVVCVAILSKKPLEACSGAQSARFERPENEPVTRFQRERGALARTPAREAKIVAQNTIQGASGCEGEPHTQPPALERHDLRDRFIFTIDPATARDFDDALSVDFIDGQMRLGVHIADVSAYVPWSSALDLDARRRATSTYLPDRVIPMLPAQLSEELCSLKPHEDRLAFTVDLLIRSDGTVEQADFYPSLINSKARLEYTQVQQMLDEVGVKGAVDPALLSKLQALDKLARKLARRREQRGAIDFEGTEAKLTLDEHGTPLSVHLRTKTNATSLVEEAMILANEQVALYMLERKAPMVYRIHDEPFQAALDELLPTLQEFGYAAQHAPQTSFDIQAILHASKGHDEHELISSLLLRAMKRARYAPLFTTHFGLMSPAYTHFTSPIRRYPDLMAHRLLKYQLAEDAASRPRPLAWSEAQSQGPANDFQPEPSSSYESMTAQLPWICAHCSDQEREAEQASYEALALKLCEYLAPQTGQHFSGIITGVNSYGFYVREDTTTAEGFVEREGLADAYEYDPAHHRYVDPNTTTHYRLGQRIPLTLKAVNTSKSTLIFETG